MYSDHSFLLSTLSIGTFWEKIFLALHNKVAINCNYSRTEPLLLFLAPFAESRC